MALLALSNAGVPAQNFENIYKLYIIYQMDAFAFQRGWFRTLVPVENCECNEQEGQFLFAYLMIPICWYPPPSKASWYNARESAESGGTIYYKHYYRNKLFE